MPAGGVVQPDGRPPQAKGVGQTARRHDLEAQPGVGNTDLQHGDRQRLEAAQRVAPRAKQQNGSGRAAAPQPKRRRKAAGTAQVPDPIEFASSRPGKPFDSTATGVPGPPVDPEPWMPMIREMAINPGSSGAISNAYIKLLSARRQRPVAPNVSVVDLQQLDDILLEG
jgi:hypothetical protein